jgi:hypothetical protein
LETLTAVVLMAFYAVVEHTATPGALVLASGYFVTAGFCRAHKVSELVSLGYSLHHVRIFLEVAVCLIMLLVVFIDVLLFAFKVSNLRARMEISSVHSFST